MPSIRQLFFRCALAPCTVLVCAIAIIALGQSASAAPTRIAVMGDSISAPSSTNWVAQLNSDFPGTFSFQNKAQSGATTDTVISGQLTSVKGMASGGTIDASVLVIGGNNDLSLDGLAVVTGGDPAPFINNYVNDVKQILSTIAGVNPNVKQVFANMPDITVTPEVQSQAAGGGITPEMLSLLSAAIGQANAQANQYALEHGVAVVNLYGASHSLLISPPYVLAGHTYSTPFASDGFHPATWVQGLLGNMITGAFNAKWGMTLPRLSDQQIVGNTGFPQPGGPATYLDVSPFILIAVPEPSTWFLATMGGALLAVRAARHRRALAA